MNEIINVLTPSLSDTVETCVPWAENTTQQIDLAFNIFFMVYFFIRVKTHLLIDKVEGRPNSFSTLP